MVIGRVVSALEARGRGLGHGLMERALEEAGRRWPGMPVYLSAQAHLQGYYGRYGFAAVTEVYLEDDIPHIGMRRA
ncbi:putative acyltransferase [compost metagenome]